MGSLGAVHKDNIGAMKAMGIQNFKHTDLLKLAVSDVIRGSSEIMLTCRVHIQETLVIGGNLPVDLFQVI